MGNMHIQNVHERKEDFKCQICHTDFKIAEDLKRHIAIVHENQTNYKHEKTNDYIPERIEIKNKEILEFNVNIVMPKKEIKVEKDYNVPHEMDAIINPENEIDVNITSKIEIKEEIDFSI